MSNPLLDLAFLKKLYANRQRVTYLKIISLDATGAPCEQLQGIATGGSINIDGASSVRRSCTLSLVTSLTDSVKIHDIKWSLSTEFKVYVGLANQIDKNYPDIIWFPQGHFLISSFTYTQDMTKYTINISGKDKMCKLNGELGGTFTALTQDLGQVEQELPDGTYIIEPLKIKEIITNLVHWYGNEPLSNIILNNLDKSGMQLLEYRGTTPMYLFKDLHGNFVDYTVAEDTQVALISAPNVALPINDKSIIYERPGVKEDFKRRPSEIYITKNGAIDTSAVYTIMQLRFGEIAGYKETDLVYAGKLTANLGETIVTVLDKIKTMLVNYEYFYNLDGQFVFQEKPSKVSLELNKNTIDLLIPSHEDFVDFWNFEGNDLLTQIAATTPINNIKNDFTVWGKNNNKTLHLRYAVHKKPYYYKSYDGNLFITSEYSDKTATMKIYDWRELLYRMAKDYNDYHNQLDFRRVIQNNNIVDGVSLYPMGTTGYETYYQDMAEFWRQNYDPDPTPYYQQINYNEDDPTYNNRYVQLFKKYIHIPDKDKALVNHKDMYVIHQDSRGVPLLQRWIDTVDLTKTEAAYGYSLLKNNQSIVHPTTGQLLYTNVLYFYEDASQIPEHLATEAWTQGAVLTLVGPETDDQIYLNEKQIDFMNSLCLQQSSTYPKIIDTIDLDSYQLYARLQDPYSEEYEYTLLIDSLDEDFQDKIYISQGENGALRKYRDGYPVMNYASFKDNITLYSQAFWLSSSNINGEVYEIYYVFPNAAKSGEQSLIWQYIHGQKLTDDDITLIMRALENHKNQIRVKVRGHEDMIALGETDTLTVRGKLNTDSARFWFKESEDAEKVSLYKKILTYTKQTEIVNNTISIYALFLQKDNNDIKSILEYIDVDKGAIWYASAQADGGDIYVPLVDVLFPDNINDIFIKTNEKINLLEYQDTALYDNFVEIYSSDPEALNDPDFTNLSLNQYAQAQKLNIFGAPHIYGGTELIQTRLNYYWQYYDYILHSDNDYSNCWNQAFYEDFQKAIFWIDFLSTDGAAGRYGVDKIGLRQKTQNITAVTGIDFGEIPNIMFTPEIKTDLVGYSQILITDNINQLFTAGARGASCIETIEQWVGQYLFLQNAVTLTCAPIYHLEPNYLISLLNDNKNIEGDYEITKITIPLNYNGTSTINCSKIIENLY